MSLSVSSNLSYARMSLATLQAGVAAQPAPGTNPTAALLSETAEAWSWAPPTIRSGRRDASVSSLMALLSQMVSPASDASSRDGSGRSAGGSLSPGADEDPSAEASLADSPEEAGVRPVAATRDGVAPSTSVSIAPTVGAASGDGSADVELKLEALFRTLQAYGL